MKVGNGELPWTALPYGAGGSPAFAESRVIDEPNAIAEYDATHATSFGLFWRFQDGAQGTHIPRISARFGTFLFFICENQTDQEQQLGGENFENIFLRGHDMQPVATIPPGSWWGATGSVLTDQEVTRTVFIVGSA